MCYYKYERINFFKKGAKYYDNQRSYRNAFRDFQSTYGDSGTSL